MVHRGHVGFVGVEVLGLRHLEVQSGLQMQTRCAGSGVASNLRVARLLRLAVVRQVDHDDHLGEGAVGDALLDGLLSQGRGSGGDHGGARCDFGGSRIRPGGKGSSESRPERGRGLAYGGGLSQKRPKLIFPRVSFGLRTGLEASESLEGPALGSRERSRQAASLGAHVGYRRREWLGVPDESAGWGAGPWTQVRRGGTKKGPTPMRTPKQAPEEEYPFFRPSGPRAREGSDKTDRWFGFRNGENR